MKKCVDGELLNMTPEDIEDFEESQIDFQPPVAQIISDRQFFEALAAKELITESEALDAVGPGIIPNQMLQLISQLPASQQFSAKMLIRGATTFERSNSLAVVIGSLYGWDEGDLDDFWNYAATL